MHPRVAADDILPVIVGSAVLLLALVGAPLLGSALQNAVARTGRASPYQQALILPVSAGLALVSAWLLLAQTDWQIVVGGWSPVSLIGVPLALSDFPPAYGPLIAWVATYLAHLLTNAPATLLRPADYALLSVALLLVAFANNFITLLVGLGLVDLFTFYRSLRHGANEPRAAWLGLALNSGAVLSLTMLGALHAAGGGSLHLPLMQLSPSAAPLLALVVALRLGFVPFRLPTSPQAELPAQAGLLSTFLLLMRLPQLGVTLLPAWFYLLGIISALLFLLVRDPRAPHPAIAAAGAHLAALSIATATPSAIAASATAWLLGVALTSPLPAGLRWGDLAARLSGAACLAGFPLSLGFLGQADLLTLWAEQGAVGWLLILGWLAVLAILANALSALMIATPTDPPTAPAWRWWISRLALLIPVILFSAFPALLEAETWLSQRSLTGGLAWLAAASSGVLLWRIKTRWPAERWSSLGFMPAVLALDWLHDLLGGTVRRLSRPFESAFTILEGDGTLAWAALIALVLILLARAGGP